MTERYPWHDRARQNTIQFRFRVLLLHVLHSHYVRRRKQPLPNTTPRANPLIPQTIDAMPRTTALSISAHGATKN
jgi:hypothetical protein